MLRENNKIKFENILIVIISFAISIIGVEMLLRTIGYQPWHNATLDKNEPTMHEYDPVLGWKNKEGYFQIPTYHPGGDEIHVTFLKNGMRRTCEHQGNVRDERPKIIFVGGSFTQGLAISDHETYSWKVQKAIPTSEVLNYGTGGYGTYQSLLVLEKILPTLKKPGIVVYGFIHHHESRNVASANWMGVLSRYSKRGHIYVPYVTLDKNDMLCRNQPEKYPSWPYKDRWAAITMVERKFVELKTSSREKQAGAVTKKLLLRMQELCHKHGAEFVIAILNLNDEVKADYMTFMKRNNLMVIDCAFPLTEVMKVKGEGHPNGRMNSKWAKGITEFIFTQNLTNRSVTIYRAGDR